MDSISNLLDTVIDTVSNFVMSNPIVLLAILVMGGLWLFLSDDDDYRYRGRGRRDYRDDRYYDDRDYR
ncbi:MAG: hypothetical protein DI609_05260 [Corynebacterium urealyticum]|uniref:Uncharacterized protein n=1 Tax=Corynebacterium urealyticum TaxID=43771 RepID=A0A2W5B5H1_9CORY|nr:MAG: hypothetical protein DI609_05260 [Corynebacterium urealyticum]